MAFETVRRVAGLRSEPRRPYVCRGCGHRFEVVYQVCPACGGFSVERLSYDD